MSKHCCCCIPVRFGVFFFSLITFLLNGAGAGIAWAIVYNIEKGTQIDDFDFGKIDNTTKIILIVAASIYTLLALVSLGGLFGAIFRKRGLVKTYSIFTWIMFLFYVASTGMVLYCVYSGKTIGNGCTITDKSDNCRFNYPTWQKVVITVVDVFFIFVHLYIALVIGRYVDQLYEEKEWKEYKLATSANNSTYTPSYYPSTVQETHQGLLNPSGQYPYTDAAHSFGNKA